MIAALIPEPYTFVVLLVCSIAGGVLVVCEFRRVLREEDESDLAEANRALGELQERSKWSRSA